MKSKKNIYNIHKKKFKIAVHTIAALVMINKELKEKKL